MCLSFFEALPDDTQLLKDRLLMGEFTPSLPVEMVVVVVTSLGERGTGSGGVWSHVFTGWPPTPWMKIILCQGEDQKVRTCSLCAETR